MKGTGDVSHQCVHLKYLQPVYENKTGLQKVRGHSSFRLVTYNYMYAMNPDRRRQYLRLIWVLWAPGRAEAEVSTVPSEQER